jgi:hypothetical protein
MKRNSLTASPKAPKPKIATLDPACTLAAFHAAPTPNQVKHHIHKSKIRKTRIQSESPEIFDIYMIMGGTREPGA